MSELNPQPLPPKAIRVAVPGDYLNDLAQFQKIQASVLGRLGCPGCTSGFQIDWHLYENWVVDLHGAVNPVEVGALAGQRLG